jgi:hypothetical protein
MSDADIFVAKPMTGTGGLAFPSAYRPLRNSGSDKQRADVADLWEQILWSITNVGMHADPHLEEFEEFTVPRWDGENAAAIAKEDLGFARKLLERIGPYLPFEPDAAPGTDGSICMEWVSDAAVGSKKIFLDVAPSGTVLVYSRLGNRRPSEKHFKKDDPTLLVYLYHLFDFFATA